MSTRVSKLASVIIPVADQDRAARFYTETLGLEKRADVPFGGGRWIEVAPPGAETPIAICPPGISLATDDADAYHALLKDRGADVDAEVSRFGEGAPPLFWFRDPEGNTLMVAEVR
jgi:catechol 2,3-dioxygenase-like lactoylglutathione lyase family enzyme